MALKVDGYIVELMDGEGGLQVWRKAASSSEMLVISASLEPSRRGQYRYQAEKVIPPKWVNVVLMPKDFTYVEYSAIVPKQLWVPRRPYVHVGPSFRVIYHPGVHGTVLGVYYLNPEPWRSMRLRIRMDISPIVHAPDGIPLFELWSAVDIFSRDRFPDDLIAQIVDQAFEDYRNPEVEKFREEVRTAQEASHVFYFLTPRALRTALEKIEGIEIVRGGRHQFKAVNRNNGRTAPVADHPGELPHYRPRQIARELDIPFDELLVAVGRKKKRGTGR